MLLSLDSEAKAKRFRCRAAGLLKKGRAPLMAREVVAWHDLLVGDWGSLHTTVDRALGAPRQTFEAVRFHVLGILDMGLRGKLQEAAERCDAAWDQVRPSPPQGRCLMPRPSSVAMADTRPPLPQRRAHIDEGHGRRPGHFDAPAHGVVRLWP